MLPVKSEAKSEAKIHSTTLGLLPVHRHTLQCMAVHRKELHISRVNRIVRSIYASVLHAAKRKQKSYSYCIPQLTINSGIQEEQLRRELLADVVYDVTVLFPDSTVSSRRGSGVDIINVEWF